MFTFTKSQTKTESVSPPQTISSQPVMPLSLAAQGETVVIHQIRGGKKLRQRLMDLGLNLSEPIRILKNDIPCPMIIAVKGDSRLALGRDMTQKIMVTLVANNNHSGDRQ